MYLIYAKHRSDNKFRPMDMTLGCPTSKLMYATMYDEKDKDKLDSLVRELSNENKDWSFELRKHN